MVRYGCVGVVVHLCRLLQGVTTTAAVVPGLLLCALVQIASQCRRECSYRPYFCSVHLYSLLHALIKAIYKVGSFCSVHLYRLLRDSASAGSQGVCLLLCALVQIASQPALVVSAVVTLLLCALVQIASAELHKSLSRNE